MHPGSPAKHRPWREGTGGRWEGRKGGRARTGDNGRDEEPHMVIRSNSLSMMVLDTPRNKDLGHYTNYYYYFVSQMVVNSVIVSVIESFQSLLTSSSSFSFKAIFKVNLFI